MRLLHRILHRFSVGVCGPLKVFVGDLQIVLQGDRLRVANPGTDGLNQELFGQFGFPRAAEVLEQFGPGLQAGTPDDFCQLRPQVGVRAAVAGDEKFELAECSKSVFLHPHQNLL